MPLTTSFIAKRPCTTAPMVDPKEFSLRLRAPKYVKLDALTPPKMAETTKTTILIALIPLPGDQRPLPPLG